MHAVLEEVAGQIARELDGLDAHGANEHPAGNIHQWNIQQVAAHLVLTYRLTAMTMEARLAKGFVTHKQRRSPLQRVLQLMVLSFGYLPQGAPALDETVPAKDLFPAMSGRELGRLLCQEMDAMDAVLDRCRRRFGMERVAVHPILGPLRVDQWRRFNALHSAHHLRQIQRVREMVAPQALPQRSRHVALAKELQVPVQRPFA